MKRMPIAVAMLFIGVAPGADAADWKPVAGKLMTRWAADVQPDRVHSEYPRPQLVRSEWLSLNGVWEFATLPKNASRPQKLDGQILVPFPVESALSGVMQMVGPDKNVWYRRTFELPPKWKSQRTILHFGAVDWECTVWVNGHEIGAHRGGYDPFDFDITKFLTDSAAQELVVRVWDPSDASTQPRGKQVRKPEGIWYTPTTGIWQTVWIERPEVAIQRLKIENVDLQSVRIHVSADGAPAGARVVVAAIDGDNVVGTAEGPASEVLRLAPAGGKLWTPDKPFLYGLRVSLLIGQQKADEVNSYFGLRTIGLGRDEKGVTRLMLNDQPVFQFGPLDQGFWPDGLYTAPTDEALRYDIETTKNLGFNMCRKHVKVEPDRWYYWCDKLGLLVWQDMPSGDRYIGQNDPDIKRTPESTEQFERELGRLIDSFGNHPCIVMWVPFNEGWGQFDTARIAKWVKDRDPLRLVNSTSGWADRGVGDVHDIHVYPGPGAEKPEPNRASVLGEFGGLGLPIRGHTWQDEKNWGYRSFTNPADLNTAYLQLIHRLRPMVHDPGLSAAVYTQTTDVEIEVNGVLTYDRATLKLNADDIAAAHRKLYGPPPTISVIVPTSQQEGLKWKYTFERPEGNWQSEVFEDSDWKSGPGGFGTKGTPRTVVRTQWNTPDIWLRRTLELPDGVKPEELNFLLHHDEDAEIFVNGREVLKVSGYTTDYLLEPIDGKAASAFHPGANVIAVHCHQTGGGQYIDVGLVQLKEKN